MEKEYKQIQKKAFYLTVLSNVIFFLLLMIIVAWRETYPPPEEYGIELGFESINNSELYESENSNDTESIEESSEKTINEANNISNEKVVEENDKMENSEDLVNNDESNNQNYDNTNESDVLIEETNTNNSNNQDEESSISSENIIDSSSTSNSSNQIIDERAIYNSTKTSGAKGSSLEMQGWIWDFEPNPQDKSSESGKIVFEITVDYYGEIVGLKTIETTLSPKVENIYKEEILKLTFSPTNNRNPADISKGKITFIIKTN